MKGITLKIIACGAILMLTGILAPRFSQAQPIFTPLDTGFTYQGRLVKSGSPLTGKCDLQFSLWDQPGSGNPPTGGNQFGATQTITNQVVSNGLFSAVLNKAGQFSGMPFMGQKLYLQVAVRSPAGSGAYTALAPRQELTPAPYALGLKPGARIWNMLTVPAEAFGLDLFSKNGTGLTVAAGSASGLAVNAENLNGGTALAAKASTTVTNAGAIKAENMAGGNAVYGVSNATVSSGNAALKGENTAEGVAVLGRSNLVNAFSGSIRGENSAGGNAVYGETTSANAAGVKGYNAGTGAGVIGRGAFGHGVFGESNTTNYAARASGVYGRSNATIGVYGVSVDHEGVFGESTDGNGVYGASVQAYGITGYSNASDAIYGYSKNGHALHGIVNSPAKAGVFGENVGLGNAVHGLAAAKGTGVKGESGAPSGINPYTSTQGVGAWGDSNNGIGVLGTSSAGAGVYGATSKGAQTFGVQGFNLNGPAVGGYTNSGIGVASISGFTGDLFVGGPGTVDNGQLSLNPTFRVNNSGKVSANGGVVTSGKDLCRIVPYSGTFPLPGDVVEIDPANPGKFRRTSTANSTLVAGVIDLQPGLTLGETNPGVNAGPTGPRLALSGIIQVNATASGGAITPGNLLVSSATAGYAMRAPASPAVGTVIGKALGSLASGTGKIEMLVMLR